MRLVVLTVPMKPARETRRKKIRCYPSWRIVKKYRKRYGYVPAISAEELGQIFVDEARGVVYCYPQMEMEVRSALSGGGDGRG